MRRSLASGLAALACMVALATCHSDKPEDQVRKAFEATRKWI
jgi:hypothetical protein